ncbi:MAG TPA: PfkB family carbohydrate kinase [Bacilli bacterium]|nr:PfkB family carbohydrate kinase [Bacilli bacterium]
MTISVIGTVFVDVKGHAHNKINSDTKNVGHVSFSHGGVGRNVAEAICRAGGKVDFYSSVDLTAEGTAVLDRLQKIGIGTDNVVQLDKGMGMWLAVLDNDGDLAASVSQKPDLSKLERLVQGQGEDMVRTSDAVVIELDLAASVVEKVFAWSEQYNTPVYGIVGNLEVLLANPALIDRLELFTCNQSEAETFLERSLTSVEECKMAARDMTAGGLNMAVITMGAEGSVFYDRKTDSFGYVPVQPVEVKDTTGAGDSFFSGTVYGLSSGFDLERAVQCGTHLAAWTISSQENVDPMISEKVKTNAYFQGIASVR